MTPWPRRSVPCLTSSAHSLTWDQGPEMRDWKSVAVDAGIDIYFCDPHSPWQRGTNANTNGRLRQYFPKGSDLSVHNAADLDWLEQQLHDRPRKRLGFAKPVEQIVSAICCRPDSTASPPNAHDHFPRIWTAAWSRHAWVSS